ncbi:MAG: Ku protein [Myxococcaceae bacterium]|nr:Ku protein [Myxococcaceae bacterium]
MWKGAISFGLVTIPVSLGVAVRQKDVRFHQVHDKDGGRIRQKRVCELDGKEVPYAHIAKGYELSKGKVVMVGRDELKALDPKADKTIAIESFVDPAGVDPIYFEHTYYVVPDAKSGAGAKAYALFTTALEKLGHVAVARIVISTKEHMCLLRPRDGMLMLTTMVYGDEVTKAPSVPHPATSAKELELARALMHSMAGRFTPDDYRDEHRKRVEKLLAQKAAGKTIDLPEKEEETAPVGDLLEALQASLSGKKPEKSERKKKAAKPKRATRSTKARKRTSA